MFRLLGIYKFGLFLALAIASCRVVFVVKDFPIKVQFLSCLLEIGSQNSQPLTQGF